MRYPTVPIRFVLSAIAFILCTSMLSLAQAPAQGGWRRVGDAPPAAATAPATAQADRSDPAAPAAAQQDPTEPVDRSDAYGQPAPSATAPQTAPAQDAVPQDGAAAQQPMPQSTTPPATTMQSQRPASTRPAYGLPPVLNLQPGTLMNVRVNQMLSSDRNHAGDPFSATLMQPVIVNGVVVASRGQTVYGRVADAEKAHAGKDSRLGLELTGLTLADGTQVPIHSQLVTRQGPTTPGGVEAGTVVGTTAVGAAVGGAVGWGTGAAVGAGAGAIAGLAGVMLTHNHPTVLYPETALTFQVTSPVTVSTVNAPQAFRFVGPEDYQQQARPQFANRPPAGAYPPGAGYAAPAYAPAPYYYGPGYYPGYYPYYSYYPYYWGPGVSVAVGGGGGFGRGFGRRW